jgi:hypothetical protein
VRLAPGIGDRRRLAALGVLGATAALIDPCTTGIEAVVGSK